MKLNLRAALPLLMGVALFYSSCKKTENKPVAKVTSDDEASAAIASNLVKSLSGAYGGASVKDGVGASTTASPKLKVQSTKYLCGFFNDDNIYLTYNQGDSIKTIVQGSIDYFFICKNDQTIGYDLADSLISVGKGPGYSFGYALVQNYKVRGLTTNNSNFSLSGRLKSWVDFNFTDKPKSSTFVHNTFHLIDLYIKTDDNFDIVSGSADFESHGVGTTGSWDLFGTIKFLGNHKAKLTFLSKIYYVDLITGVVTPA